MGRPRLELKEKVYSKLSPQGNCLIWTGRITTGGYPEVVHLGKYISVSRYVYMKETGEKLELSENLIHVCGNKKCVNPLHLERKKK